MRKFFLFLLLSFALVLGAPSVVLITPLNGSSTFYPNVTFTVNATGMGIANVTLYSNYSGSWSNFTPINPSGGQYTLSQYVAPARGIVWNARFCDSTGCAFAPTNFTFDKVTPPLSLEIESVGLTAWEIALVAYFAIAILLFTNDYIRLLFLGLAVIFAVTGLEVLFITAVELGSSTLSSAVGGLITFAMSVIVTGLTYVLIAFFAYKVVSEYLLKKRHVKA